MPRLTRPDPTVSDPHKTKVCIILTPLSHKPVVPTAFKMMTISSKRFNSDLQLFSLISHHILSLHSHPARPFLTPCLSLYLGIPFLSKNALKNMPPLRNPHFL